MAQALDTGALRAPYPSLSVQSALGQPSDGVPDALNHLAEVGVADRGAAAFVRALDDAIRPVRQPDVVWSGPELAGLPARDTARVYEELFSSAQHSLWAVSYAYFDGPKVFCTLARRMDEHPDLEVKLLLNIDRRRGDKTLPDDLVRRFAEQFWGRDWPGERRPVVFYDPRSVESGAKGVLHAKAVVTDDESVFITSANFTARALNHNVELGFIVRNRALAGRVVTHLQGLIDRRHLLPLPG